VCTGKDIAGERFTGVMTPKRARKEKVRGKKQRREENSLSSLPGIEGKNLPDPGCSLQILKEILGKSDLESVLKQASGCLCDLFGLDLVSFVYSDVYNEKYKIGAMVSCSSSYHYLVGREYRVGDSEEIDSWLTKIFQKKYVVLDEREMVSLLEMMGREGVFSGETVTSAIVNVRSSKNSRYIFSSRSGLDGTPLLIALYKIDREMKEREREVLGMLEQIISISLEGRLRNEALQNRLSKYQSITDSCEQAFFLLVEGKIEFFSKQFPRIMGQPASTLIRTSLEEHLESDDREHFREVVAGLMDEEDFTTRSYFHAYRLCDSDKEVEISLYVVDYKGKKVLRGTVNDISERSLLEKNAMDEKRMEGIANLAASVSHDFNNLIGAMIGYSSLVRNSLHPNDERVRQLMKLEKAGARAAKLTQQILSISRRGKHVIEVVDMKEIVERVCRSCIMPMDHISVTKEFNASTMNVEGDPGQLYEALLCLCKNARDSMPGGGEVRVKTDIVSLGRESHEFREGMASGDYLRIEFKDEGSGMESEVLKRAEEPFFTTKREKGRRGLGLPVASGIIKGHSGTLNIKSKLGEGTEAVILLPVTEESVESIRSSVARGREGTVTILVVDDEEIVCCLASDMIKRLGYQPLTALGGKEALKIAEDSEVDLVILDLVMPEMNGQEVFYSLKESYPDLPVIISSAYSEDAVIQRLMSEGAKSFLKKPYRLRNLSVAVREALEIQEEIT
jgi:two-component system cell cycle sensor histidine kinase/response regulator CckA